jgi:sporulation protein YlmC with PRC-barrel domain
MLEEVSELIGLQVYTSKGIFLGNVNNLIIDVSNCQIESLFIGDTNPLLIEDSKNVSLPYRWIQSIGDIVILRYFPGRISLKHEEGEGEDSQKPLFNM